MADIVKRLREYNSIPAVGSKLRIGKAIADAAEEIERLRELNGAWKLTVNDLCEIIEKLRVALQQIADMQTSEEDGVNKALLILSTSIARKALGEKE